MNKKRTRLPRLAKPQLDAIVETLTPARMGRYLSTAQGNRQEALRLYIFNTKISSAIMADIHFVEVALRNKFDRELTRFFGVRWFSENALLSVVDGRAQSILQKAQRDAGRLFNGQPPPGKVIAELTLGFWSTLTDRRYEHTLWVPCLHKSFYSQPPRRSVFNQQLEKIRQLRNRTAHHEPIFHLDLLGAHKAMAEVCAVLCPATAGVMISTSDTPRVIQLASKYRRRHGF
ncbi:Abi family protein [Xanthomonas arboricola]|uniref:Abi family protein n=1 Tax=Xanthomonas arboricola TaxID=56448 RepID=UPI002B2EA9DC|nr:Abi family protein [Xanthomonas arboricola]